MITHLDHFHLIDRYSADQANSYRFSHVILADHNRKEPKENILAYTDFILGNSNVLLALIKEIRPHWRFLRKRVTFYFTCMPYKRTHIQLSSHTHSLVYAPDMPRVHFPKTFAV